MLVNELMTRQIEWTSSTTNASGRFRGHTARSTLRRLPRRRSRSCGSAPTRRRERPMQTRLHDGHGALVSLPSGRQPSINPDPARFARMAGIKVLHSNWRRNIQDRGYQARPLRLRVVQAAATAPSQAGSFGGTSAPVGKKSALRTTVCRPPPTGRH